MPPGHMRNFLYPQKKAVYATEANKAKLVQTKQEVDADVLEFQRLVEKVQQRLNKYPLVFRRQLLAGKSLKSEVNAEMVQESLEKHHGIKVDLECIKLPDERPIKSTGTYEAEIVIDNIPQMITDPEKDGKVVIKANVEVVPR